MAKRLECFFDCSSPWTYLAFEGALPIAERHGVQIEWRPILVGGVFNAVNPSVYENRERPVPVKARYYAKDLADWAQAAGLRIGQPSVFPVNSVKVMRGAFLADREGLLVPYARRVFEAYWGDLADISQDAVITGLLEDVGIDPQRFFEWIASPEAKQLLRDNTDEVIRRGGFGSPTFFVDGDDMYFGNDRLPLVELALQRPALR
ncbi:MAG: 2-hydroxychromene-2-carboxylate isomerase [Gammaproteobacteria bacterium]|nr:MAG: 2-hydroxychromene-2-carboxylate isomerase [Gammaproteobacteria bacterium]